MHFDSVATQTRDAEKRAAAMLHLYDALQLHCDQRW